MKTRALTVAVLMAVVSGPVMAALSSGEAIIPGWTHMRTGKHSGTFDSSIWYTTEGTPDHHDGGSAVAITPDKRVFMTDYTDRVVFELDEDANIVNSAFINYPTDVIFNTLLLDSDNNLYAGCNDGKVRKYSPTGADLGVYADIGAWVIADMDWGTAPGTMFMSEVDYTGQVFKWDGAAASLFASVGPGARGRGVAVSDGHVFVNNGNARTLYKYDEITGAEIGSAVYPEGIKPRGMTTGPDGRIYSALEYGPPAGLVIDLDLTEFLQFGGSRVANAGDIAFYVEPPPKVRTWGFNRSGDWNAGANWDVNEAPNANEHTAVFGDAIASPRTVYTDADVTVRSIQFDNASASYAITGHGTVTVESDDPGTDPSMIDVLSGNHEFQTKVTLNNDAEVSVADTYALSMNNQLSLGGNTLTKTGDGTLSINNEMTTGGGSVVGLAGTITGGGTVGGNLTNTSATVAPGNSPGTLTVTGDFSQAIGGTLAMELAGTADGEFDVLAVTGSASLGGSLAITELYTPGGADSWTILAAVGGITGTFDTITAGYSVALANGDTELVLSLGGALLPGDANGDGCVDDLDLTALAVHWQQSTNLWEDGDFNGDGIVDDLDLTALAVNWQQGCGGGGSFADAVATNGVIPEPASALIMLLGFAGVARRRKK